MTKICQINFTSTSLTFSTQDNTQAAFAETDKPALHFKHFHNTKSELKEPSYFKTDQETLSKNGLTINHSSIAPKETAALLYTTKVVSAKAHHI